MQDADVAARMDETRTLLWSAHFQQRSENALAKRDRDGLIPRSLKAAPARLAQW
jgi:hypothetical protein